MNRRIPLFSNQPISLVFLAVRICFAGAFPQVVRAADESDHNVHAWFSYVGDHNVSQRWGIHLEAQFRRADYVDEWQQILLRPGINFSLNPKVSFSAGYCHVKTYPYGEFPARDDFPEDRAWQQALFKARGFGADWIHRFRLEQRNIGVPMPDGSGGYRTGDHRFENRIRYQLRTAFPLTADGRLKFLVWDELFFNFGPEVRGNVFDQNRLFLGISRDLGRGFRLETGLMEQTLQRRGGSIWEHNHTFILSLVSNASFRSSKP